MKQTLLRCPAPLDGARRGYWSGFDLAITRAANAAFAIPRECSTAASWAAVSSGSAALAAFLDLPDMEAFGQNSAAKSWRHDHHSFHPSRVESKQQAIAMPLYIIGLGLGDERDITVKGADAIRKCDRVFLESYTSVLAVPAERLEEMYGKKVEIAYRETVESEAEKILEPAKTGSVAFLVVGDPFGCGARHVGRVQSCRGSRSRPTVVPALARPPAPAAAVLPPTRTSSFAPRSWASRRTSSTTRPS